MVEKKYKYNIDLNNYNLDQSLINTLNVLMTGSPEIQNIVELNFKNVDDLAVNKVIVKHGDLISQSVVDTYVEKHNLSPLFAWITDYFGVIDADTNDTVTANTTRFKVAQTWNPDVILDSTVDVYIGRTLAYKQAQYQAGPSVDIHYSADELCIVSDINMTSSDPSRTISYLYALSEYDVRDGFQNGWLSSLPDGYESVDAYINDYLNHNWPLVEKYTEYYDENNNFINDEDILLQPGDIFELTSPFIDPIDPENYQPSTNLSFYDLEGNKLFDATSIQEMVQNLNTYAAKGDIINVPTSHASEEIIPPFTIWHYTEDEFDQRQNELDSYGIGYTALEYLYTLNNIGADRAAEILEMMPSTSRPLIYTSEVDAPIPWPDLIYDATTRAIIIEFDDELTMHELPRLGFGQAQNAEIPQSTILMLPLGTSLNTNQESAPTSDNYIGEWVTFDNYGRAVPLKTIYQSIVGEETDSFAVEVPDYAIGPVR